MTERMGTRLAVLAGAACITGAGLAGVATPAGAQQTDPAAAAVVVFTGTASVNENMSTPGLGPSAAGASFGFTTEFGGIARANLCAGVTADASGGTTSGADISLPPNVPGDNLGDCVLDLGGTLHSGLLGLGAFCGYSSGSGTATLKIGTRGFDGMTVSWPQSAGETLPLVFGGSVTGFGVAQGYGWEFPRLCNVLHSGRSFTLTGFAAIAATGTVPPPPPDPGTDLVEVVEPGPGDEPSAACEASGGTQVIDATTAGVHAKLYAHQPSSDEVWVCTRVEDTTSGDGAGGRLVVTPGGAVPSVTGGPGAPSTDDRSDACTATTDPPNQVPGSHPISSGGVAGMPYLVDAYANDAEAWLCLQVDTTETRVIVPIGGAAPEVSFGTAVTWEPDPGTPPA